MRHASLALLACLAAPATAQTAPPQPVEIALESFRYEPATITLDHGRSYALRLVNRSSGGHDFAAKEFFAAAELSPADRAKVVKGKVAVDGGESVTLSLTAPPPGRYPVRCTHFMHSAFGMKGQILVR